MKNKILFSFLGVLVMVALIVILGKGVNAVKQSKNDLPLILKVSSEKQTYILGEVVKLNFELINKGDKVIKIPLRPDVSTGYLKVWIALDEQEFNRYNNSSWGRMEHGGPTLQPDESFNSQATILWNSKPETLNLNPDVAKGKIMNDYAFPQAGVYSIKAVASITGDTPMKIESESIQIVINEPVGDDLKVWNQIKDSGEIASFIQRGSFLTSKVEEEAKLVKRVEQITQSYPNSFLAGQMKQKLEKFRTGEERRREMLEKAGVKPKN
jgi:hypothetical protein